MTPAARDHDPVAMAFDIGGTKVGAGLVDSRGQLHHRQEQPSTRGDGNRQLAEIQDLTERLRRTAKDDGRDLVGVGIGVPELVDRDGVIRGAANFPWRDVDLADALALALPTFIESDVRAAAVAEARIGAGIPYARWLYVTIGSGISGCLVTDGVPEPGGQGFAIHLANSPVRMPCTSCGQASSQTLEDVASGRGIVQAAVDAGADVSRVEEVLRAAQDGDKRLADLVVRAARAIGSGIALAVNSTDPEAVVLGGGLGQAEGLYRDVLERALREDIVATAVKDLPVLRAAAGSDSGIIGSGLVAFDRQFTTQR